MEISQLNPYKDFSSKTKAQKVGIVAGTVAAAAAIGSVPLAYVKGKNVIADVTGKGDKIADDAFVKSEAGKALADKIAKKDGKAGFFTTLGEGYKKLGRNIKAVFTKKENTPAEKEPPTAPGKEGQTPAPTGKEGEAQAPSTTPTAAPTTAPTVAPTAAPTQAPQA